MDVGTGKGVAVDVGVGVVVWVLLCISKTRSLFYDAGALVLRCYFAVQRHTIVGITSFLPSFLPSRENRLFACARSVGCQGAYCWWGRLPSGSWFDCN